MTASLGLNYDRPVMHPCKDLWMATILLALHAHFFWHYTLPSSGPIDIAMCRPLPCINSHQAYAPQTLADLTTHSLDQPRPASIRLKAARHMLSSDQANRNHCDCRTSLFLQLVCWRLTCTGAIAATVWERISNFLPEIFSHAVSLVKPYMRARVLQLTAVHR